MAEPTKVNPHQAAGQGDVAQVKRYLKEGGAVDKRDGDGWTPCMMAVREGHLEVARLLLRAAANVDATESDKWTALHVAAANGHPNCCQLLLSRGANPRVYDDNKRTPLHWAARCRQTYITGECTHSMVLDVSFPPLTIQEGCVMPTTTR